MSTKSEAISIVHASHDHFFKKVMMDTRVAREFFETHLPTDLLRIMDLSQMQLISGSFIDDLHKETIADILFTTTIQDHLTYLHLIVEHQSTPDELMPFRILKYTCNIIDKHIKGTKNKTIPLIIPIVVYHGKDPWSYSTDIKEMVDAPSHLIETYFLKPFKLIDLNKIADETIRQKTWSGIVEFTLKHIYSDNFLQFSDVLTQLMKKIQNQNGQSLIEAVLTYILAKAQIDNEEAFFKLIKLELSEELGEKTMTIAEKLIEKGKVEGKVEGKIEGKKEGIEENTLQIAKRLLLENMDLSFIAKVTGLSQLQIQQLIISH